MSQNPYIQERYNVFAELNKLYQEAHGRYMSAIMGGNKRKIEAARTECERIEHEQTQAIALLRNDEVRQAYQHTHPAIGDKS